MPWDQTSFSITGLCFLCWIIPPIPLAILSISDHMLTLVTMVCVSKLEVFTDSADPTHFSEHFAFRPVSAECKHLL